MAAFKRGSVAKLMSKVAGNTTCPCHGVPQISTSKEYAFEMASSTIRYGPGVTKEVAFDIQNMHSKKPVIFTDRNLVGLSPVKTVLEALRKQKLDFILYDQTRVEPTDSSLRDAIDFVKKHKPDSFGKFPFSFCSITTIFKKLLLVVEVLSILLRLQIYT